MSRYQNLANTVIAARKANLDKNVITANKVQWSEPYPAYNPLYPYNNVTETDSGHALELDDTPGSERVALTHRTGTYFEVFPSGTKVEKITKSNYQIGMADDHLHVMGKVLVTIDSDVLIKTLGDVYLEVGNDMFANVSGDMKLGVGGALDIKAASVNFDVADDFTVVSGSDQFFTADGDINSSAGGSQFIGSGSATNIRAGGNFNADGSQIQLNGGASSSPTKGTVAGIPAPNARTTPNEVVVPPETAPVPLPGATAELDPFTGAAFVQQQFLTKQADGTLGQPSTVAPQPCNFDPTTRTFLSDPQQWNISDSGIALIQSFEGFAKVVSSDTVTAYPDPATGAQPYTIGYGSTQAAIGIPVTLGELISRATAADYLQLGINNEFLPALRHCITVGITQSMIDACLSLMYNIGASNFINSTLVKDINAQMWCAAGDQFLAWNKAAGQVLPGLTSRRVKERSVFLT